MAKLKKSAHVLETEELLDLIDKDDSEVEPALVFKNDVLSFISTFAIEPGTDKIKNHTLYNIYKAWSQEPLKKRSFLRQMGDFLESIRINNSHGFLINQPAIKLTHAAYKHYTNVEFSIKSQAWAKHFENFLKFHSLQAGKYWIHGDSLYIIYKRYCKATGLFINNSLHMTETAFHVYLKLYLEQKPTKRGKYYGISENILGFFQIGEIEELEKEYAKREKKEVVKKKSKRPRRSFPAS